MTDDIFDYFGGSSARKVEPVEDDFDDETGAADEEPQIDASNSLEQDSDNTGGSESFDAPDAEIAQSDGPSKEPASTASHWDRLLGKLGISSAAKKVTGPKSVEIKTLSREEKAARAEKLKAKEKARTQTDQPFGGLAAPQTSRQSFEKRVEHPAASGADKEQPRSKAENLGQPSKPAKTKPKATSKFGFGILDDVVEDDQDEPTDHDSETLTEMFTHSDEFQEPFDEPKLSEVDDVPVFESDEEPELLESESTEFDTEDGSDVEFIEYEVHDLDFDESSSADDRPHRQPSRHRARRERETSSEDRPPREPKRPARGRNRDRDDSERDTEREDVSARDEDDSTTTRRRRGSRGRGRNPSQKDSRARRDERDQWDVNEVLDDAGLEDSLDAPDLEDDLEDEEEESRSRRPRRGRGSRQTSRTRDVDQDELDDDAPKPARTRRHRGRSEAEQPSDSFDEGDPQEDSDDRTRTKRPKIPTWDEAINGMIEKNIKNHSAKGSGSSGRGRGSRRPRRR